MTDFNWIWNKGTWFIKIKCIHRVGLDQTTDLSTILKSQNVYKVVKNLYLTKFKLNFLIYICLVKDCILRPKTYRKIFVNELI